MSPIFYGIFLCFLLINSVVENVVLRISNGKIRGQKIENSEGTSFYKFQGIPYAKPPIGNLRFKEPQAPNSWNGIKNTTNNNVVCMQAQQFFSSLESEDCLYLNVYTPKLLNNTHNPRLPVMVYFFGGGYLNGNATYDTYGPHFFMNYEIIIVTFNYRLGLFGFLSTQDLVIPGNYGLKDQQFALKWVHENIEVFGGDPRKVTIFGNSAGGASVGLQMFYMNNTGLFRAGILQSGVPISTWTLQRNAKHYAYYTAQYFNSNISMKNTSSEELLTFLKSFSALELREAGTKITGENYAYHQLLEGFTYSPVIEVDHSTAFITRYMYELVEKGKFIKIPILMGLNSEESLGQNEEKEFQELTAILDANPSALVTKNFHLVNKTLKLHAGTLIKQIYLPKNGTFAKNVTAGVKYLSDFVNNAGIIKHGLLSSKFIDVYFYEFSYHGKMGNNPLFVPNAGRVQHEEENNYLWHREFNDNLRQFPNHDIITQKRLLTFWTNFAKYMKPTTCSNHSLLGNIEWKKLDSTSYFYLDIDKELTLKNHPKQNTFEPIDFVFKKYAVKPYDVY